VHYELVKPEKPIDPATLSVSPEDVMNLSSLMNAMSDVMLHHLPGNVRQLDMLHYRPEWQNHDMSTEELIQRLGSDTLRKTIDGLRAFQDAQEKMQPEQLDFLIRTIFRGMPMFSSIGRIIGDQKLRNVIVDQRNTIAVDAIKARLAENPRKNFAMIWGAEHAPGIVKGLEALGYKVSSKYWLGALALGKHR
jgi:hypothetical protein